MLKDWLAWERSTCILLGIVMKVEERKKSLGRYVDVNVVEEVKGRRKDK